MAHQRFMLLLEVAHILASGPDPGLRNDDEMDVCNRVDFTEGKAFLIFVEHSSILVDTFHDFAEERMSRCVSELACNHGVVLGWLPAADEKQRRVFFVLSEDDALFPVKIKKLPSQLFLEGERFDLKLERLRICVNISVLGLRKLDEMLHLLDVALETFTAFPPKMVKEALIWRDFTKLGRDLFENCLFGADRLVSEAALKEQIEVEVVLTEE